MSEQLKPFEKRETVETTPLPNLLDVVKIDGRWAQVFLGGSTVRYLDDKIVTEINWNDYNCQFFNKYQKANCTKIWVRDLVEEGQITKDQYASVVWCSISDPSMDPCKQFVTVFGIYTKK